MEIIELLALMLSVPALVLCLMVVRHWFPEARRVFWNPKEAADWLVLGVMVSFAGLFLNLGYWTAWWGIGLYISYDHWLRDVLLEFGVIWNLITRQVCVIAAAWCHLHAYYLFSDKKTNHPSKTLHKSALLAVLLLSVLWVLLGKGPIVF